MFTTMRAPHPEDGLDHLLRRLRSKAAVAGIVLLGTTATGLSAASDLDLLIVVAGDMTPVRSGCSWSAGRLVDLVFASHTEIRHIEMLAPPLALTDDWQGRTIGWLEQGKIAFDRDGLIERVQAFVRANSPRPDISELEQYRRWDHTNYDLAQSRRYASASSELHQEALELRLTRQLGDLMVSYFTLRSMAWRGEKEAIRYWEHHDPEYKQLLLQFLREPERARKFELYTRLATLTLAPAGGVWPVASLVFTASEGTSMEVASAFGLELLS